MKILRLAQRIRGGLHGYSGGPGHTRIRRPRLYAIVAAIGFGGRRRATYDHLVKLSGAETGDHVLDIGCGTGYLTRRAALAVGPAGRIEGIDPSPEVIAYANRRAPANTTFTVAAAEQLPHPDNAFDIVLSSLAIHHIDADKRADALREMYRVLRPGGWLLIADFRLPRNKLARRFIGHATGDAMQHNAIDQLPDLIASAGLRVTGRGGEKHSLRYIQAVRPE